MFATSWYRYLEVGNILANISAKTKYFSKIFWGIAQGPRHYGFMQKTRHQKYDANLPLNCKKIFARHQKSDANLPLNWKKIFARQFVDQTVGIVT